MKNACLAAILSVASLAFAGSVQAQIVVPKNQDIPATPIQHGAPENLPGENLIPGASLAVHTINEVTQPILQPILAPGPEKAAPAPMAMKKHHRMMRHHMSKKMMMKKMMMKKKMMKK